MSEQDKKELNSFKRQIIITLIGVLTPFLLSSIVMLVKMHEDTQILKSYKDTYYRDIVLLVDAKTKYMDAYIISNDKEKEEIKRKIERVEDQLIQLRNSLHPVRGKETTENIFR